MPGLKFSRFFLGGRAPQIASRDAFGTLPMRAVRHCEAITSATGFGWLLFPPTDLHLLWDGDTIFYTAQGIDEWTPVDDVAHFPGFPEMWNAAAPPELTGLAPSMLTALPEPGTIQIQFGVCVSLTSGWGLLIRSPVNFPSSGYTHYEGIVEPACWGGPLFINLRLTRTGSPVRLHGDRPLAQAQPLPHEAYAAKVAGSAVGMDDAAWAGYLVSVAEPHSRPDRAFGEVAAAARRDKRTGCPRGTLPPNDAALVHV
jgi:hypothetical protein